MAVGNVAGPLGQGWGHHGRRPAEPADTRENDEQPVPPDPPISRWIVADRVRAPPPTEQTTALGLVPRLRQERPGALQTIDRRTDEQARRAEPEGRAGRMWQLGWAKPEERGKQGRHRQALHQGTERVLLDQRLCLVGE